MLLGNGYVKEDVMIKDYTFENPSNAISTLLGRMENGNDSFYTLDGVKLGVYLQDLKTNRNSNVYIQFINRQEIRTGSQRCVSYPFPPSSRSDQLLLGN